MLQKPTSLRATTFYSCVPCLSSLASRAARFSRRVAVAFVASRGALCGWDGRVEVVMGPSPAASVRSWSDEEYDPNLDTAQKGTLGALNDEDHDYDPMAQNVSLTKSLTLATTLHETRDKKKQRPVVEVVTLNNTLASMHEDEVAFFTEEALGDDSAEDERTSKNDQKNASVFSLAEKQKGKEEGQRIRAEMKNMRSEPGTNDVRRTRVDDLGDFADESEWVPVRIGPFPNPASLFAHTRLTRVFCIHSTSLVTEGAVWLGLSRGPR